ncbi:hypothetical protein BC829DRAFT_412882 [Chytridium lagenaria]|nr:hypothetical protein BC829DRAFT_412882 [Chytridium lagenaria]
MADEVIVKVVNVDVVEEELEYFRASWKAELQNVTKHASTAEHKVKNDHVVPILARPKVTASFVEESPADKSINLKPKEKPISNSEAALIAYKEASRYEREGKLGEALAKSYKNMRWTILGLQGVKLTPKDMLLPVWISRLPSEVIGNNHLQNDWLMMWLDKPRIRFDGVYISRINYVREGYTESFNKPFLIVTYFRYIRFFPDGTVIFWRSPLEPAVAVKELTADLEG